MNRVLFDLRGTQPDRATKRHGGGKFGESLLRRIVDRKMYVICCYDSSKWLNEDVKSLLENNDIKMVDSVNSTLEDIALENKVDLIYVPTNINIEHLKVNKCKVLGTIHGIRDMESPVDYHQMLYKPYSNILKYFYKRLFEKRYRMKRGMFLKSILASDNFGLTTSSYHSAYSIKSFFPEYENKNIPVFYCPSTIIYDTNKSNCKEKYFLLVSGNRPIKNNLRAIMAFDRLFSKGLANDYRVKLTGVKDESVFLYNIKNKDKFDFLGFVDEKELDQLYHDAYCLVYPTLNEGFGYPPLEAMHYGAPVLASPFTSIPEVCGSAALYFNPFSIEEIMSRILMIIDDKIHLKYEALARERFDFISRKQFDDTDKLIDYIFCYQG